MPMDAPEDIDRNEGVDEGGASTFYTFIVMCIIVGAVLIVVNHFYGVSPIPPPATPVPSVQEKSNLD